MFNHLDDDDDDDDDLHFSATATEEHLQHSEKPSHRNSLGGYNYRRSIFGGSSQMTSFI